MLWWLCLVWNAASVIHKKMLHWIPSRKARRFCENIHKTLVYISQNNFKYSWLSVLTFMRKLSGWSSSLKMYNKMQVEVHMEGAKHLKDCQRDKYWHTGMHSVYVCHRGCTVYLFFSWTLRVTYVWALETRVARLALMAACTTDCHRKTWHAKIVCCAFASTK